MTKLRKAIAVMVSANEHADTEDYDGRHWVWLRYFWRWYGPSPAKPTSPAFCKWFAYGFRDP